MGASIVRKKRDAVNTPVARAKLRAAGCRRAGEQAGHDQKREPCGSVEDGAVEEVRGKLRLHPAIHELEEREERNGTDPPQPRETDEKVEQENVDEEQDRNRVRGHRPARGEGVPERTANADREKQRNHEEQIPAVAVGESRLRAPKPQRHDSRDDEGEIRDGVEGLAPQAGTGALAVGVEEGSHGSEIGSSGGEPDRDQATHHPCKNNRTPTRRDRVEADDVRCSKAALALAPSGGCASIHDVPPSSSFAP